MSETVSYYHAGTVDPSTYAKLYEIARVTEEVLKSPVRLAIGYGNGAELAVSGAAAKTTLERWGARGSFHAIHNTYFAVLFRHGLIGLALLLAVLLGFVLRSGKAYRLYRRERRSRKLLSDPYAPAVGALVLLSAVFLVLAFIGFTQDFYLGVFMGQVEWGLVFATAPLAFEHFRSLGHETPPQPNTRPS
jgi:O-antigen ligase